MIIGQPQACSVVFSLYMLSFSTACWLLLTNSPHISRNSSKSLNPVPVKLREKNLISGWGMKPDEVVKSQRASRELRTLELASHSTIDILELHLRPRTLSAHRFTHRINKISLLTTSSLPSWLEIAFASDMKWREEHSGAKTKLYFPIYLPIPYLYLPKTDRNN